MTTTQLPPVPTALVLEQDQALVVEIDLPATEPAFTVDVAAHRITVTVPCERPSRHEWHVNPDVVPD
ncbi:MAG TPA: hypothetical protein VLB86_09780 [Gaiellaceae bacterium]|nr:hypothetical protein [Gaiellaceae bacterium]